MKRDLPLVPPRKVIPVIFVPGIMGSNLKTKTAQEGTARAAYAKSKQEYTPKSWRPDDGFSLYRRNRNYPPALRQVILNKDNVEVDDEGAVDVTGLNLSEREAKERGWGEKKDGRGCFQQDLAIAQGVLAKPAQRGARRKPRAFLGGHSRTAHKRAVRLCPPRNLDQDAAGCPFYPRFSPWIPG